jgi:sugar phosphate isomerase/epimerase
VKLSAITDEISMDFDRALDALLEYGATSAELRSLWDVNIADLSDEQVARAKSALQKRRMTVCSLSTPLFKCDLSTAEGSAGGRTHQATERTLEQQSPLLERCIHLAKVFDTNVIRIFAFWRRGGLTEDIEEQIIEALRDPAKRAEEAGIILGLENEHACYLGTGKEIARVIRAVNSPGLKAVWDPGNAFCAGEVPYPDGYEAVRDFVVHVHVKDAVWCDDKPKFVCIGDGKLDYVGQLKALKADGYEGYLSLETHYSPEGGTREEGSRQCLVRLKDLLQEIET